jgi:hypothetical protein
LLFCRTQLPFGFSDNWFELLWDFREPIKESYMKIISDFAVSPRATSPVEADASMQQTSATRVLYQPGAMFQSQPLKLNSQASVATAASSVSVAKVVPALTPSDTTLPGLGNMPFYIQSGNSSGDTSLAEIMTYLGKTMTEADVQKALGDASPQDMLRFARDNGLEAEEYNNSSWDQVKQQIDQGHPVQALINGDPSGTENEITAGNGLAVSGNDLHYINITGHGTDPSTGEEYITYHDPHLGTEQRMSVSNFEQFWGDVPGGFHNYFQAYGPKGSDLPPGDDAFQNAGGGLQGTQGTLNGVANVANGWNLFSAKGANLPDMLHGAFEFAGGIPQTGLCFVSQGIQEGSSWLHDKVSGIPVLQNIVQPLTDLTGGIAGGAADIANGFGESMNDLGGAFSDLLHGDGHKALDKLGNAAEDLGSGVVHSVTDAASSVGHAIEDLFSW